MTTTRSLANTTTWINEQSPTQRNFNRTGYLALNAQAGKNQRGFIWLGAPFKLGVKVQSATLTIKTRALPAMTGRTITITPLKYSFNFNTLTWSNRPGSPSFFGTPVTVTKSGALAEDTGWVFDVTAILQQVSDGQSWGGFMLETNQATTSSVLVQNQMMGSNRKPVLDVTWSDTPLMPENLSPSGGRAVGVPKPIVRFSFADFSGDTSMAACQVQTSNSSSGFTVAWDSGEVATTVPQLDLASTSFTGVAQGAMVYWRARVKDGAGLWSPWSNVSAFTYYPMPTAKLINPSAGTVTDPTPPIDWTYTSAGSAQTAYRVGIYQVINGRRVLQEYSGKQAGAATSWTPQSSIGPDGSYVVIVDVFDGRDRESTPGSPAFASDVQEFTYKYSATVPKPLTFTATPKDPVPGVVMKWTVSSQPDRFALFRDGKPFANYPASDLSDGAGGYTITDRAPSPRTVHSYAVVSVINGVSSQPLYTTAVSRPLGTWIVATSGWTQVCVVRDRDREVSFTEVSDVHQIKGAMSSVVITSQMGGYEGTIKGVLRRLSQVPGTSAKDWKAMALDIKENPTRLHWVVFGDESFRAVLNNVQVVRSASLPDTYEFSAKFYQQSDFSYIAPF